MTAALLQQVTQFDLMLLSQGRHERLWEILGAHLVPGGATFAVWAPGAREVYVDGDFNGWDRSAGVALRRHEPYGVWTGYVPGAKQWQRYKYRILCADGVWRYKADPMAQHTECPPDTASVLFSSGYEWNDTEWMAQRTRRLPHAEPMSVYEVHLGSWRPGLSYVDLADQLVEYVSRLGFTHVELMPVMEHPYGPSWGYQVTGFYAPTARFGNPDDFRYLVDRLHQAGIGVLLDWVPAHFPRDDWALARFDGGPLYEYADPRRGEHPDWGSLIFDYGRPEVRNFLLANALFWCAEFHADGLRTDAVSSMLYLDYSRGPGQWEPNAFGGNEHLEAVSFLRELNQTVYRQNPGVVMIAEESAAWPGVSRPVEYDGLGFGLKWNMGWMHDTLQYMVKDPVYRQYHHDRLTLPCLYAYSENFLLPLSHDEVVHGKGSLVRKLPGDRYARLAGLRGLLAYQWAFPGKQLLFMGAEMAQEAEWNERAGLDWQAAGGDAAGVTQLVGDLNRNYRAEPALWTRDCSADGFRMIVSDGPGNVLAFLRRGAGGEMLVCVVNFSPVVRNDYPVPLPVPGRWDEVLNTDATCYGGTGVGCLGSVTALREPRGDQPAWAAVQLGPYAALWLRPALDTKTGSRTAR